MLKLAGGSFLGMMFTPVPWKLLDDSAIWTQNWSRIPQLPRGSVSVKYSTCAVCPGGCAIKARCTNGRPFILTGVTNHPISNGTLCPMGLTGHHMSSHPLRLATPCKFSGKKNDSKLISTSPDEATTDISTALKAGGAIAVLDQRPGRMISGVYRQFLSQFPDNFYLVSPSRESSTLQATHKMAGANSFEMGFDFENAKVILSFGAPLFDGWGTPGRMMALLNKRKETGLTVIQVESHQSRTALQSDLWLPVKPGSETVLALGLANVLISDGLVPADARKRITDIRSFEEVAAHFTPQLVAEQTGISAEQITDTAHTLARNPSVILSGCDAGGGPLTADAETAIASLNILLGNIGRQGGVMNRSTLPGSIESNIPAQSIANVPDNSIRVLIVDGAESGLAFPWSLVQRKLDPERSIVVSLSPYMTQLSAHADYLIPSPAHLESFEEVITPTGSTVASFSLSTPLIPKPDKCVEPIDFLKKLVESTRVSGFPVSSYEDLLKQRVNAIHESKRGSVFSSTNCSTTKLADVASADDLWKLFTDGACWIDEPQTTNTKTQFTLLVGSKELQSNLTSQSGEKKHSGLTLVPIGWRGATATASLSPVMSKIFQESDFRGLAGRVSISPITGSSLGISECDPVIVETVNGKLESPVHLDHGIVPGVVAITVGPMPNKTETPEHTNADNVLSLCTVCDDGTWRLTDVTIAKA